MKFCAKVVKIERTAKSKAQKKERSPIEFLSLSDSLGARTQDPILKRDVLYLLS